MLMLSDVREWLKSLDPELVEKISVGSIDGNAEKYIGVYADESGGTARLCLGGQEQTRMQSKQVKLLVHWTNSPVQAEQKAASLWQLLLGTSGQFGAYQIKTVDPGAAPISVGRDEKGICEYIIRLKIIYERI